MGRQSVVMTGASGMLGACALRLCLKDPLVESVTSIGRRKLKLEHEKLKQVVHQDFMDYSSISAQLENQTLALFCLGVYSGAVPDEEFKKITTHYTLEFAQALRAHSPQSAFCFLSGQGADQTGKSRMAFARYKGEAEKGLLAMDFPRLHIFRPGYIYPVEKRQEPNTMYRVTRALYPALRRIYPNIGVASEDLAWAMVQAGLHGTAGHEDLVLENRDIRNLAKTKSE